MSEIPAACPAATTLTAEEHRALDQLPQGANMVTWTQRCDLEARHDGPHHVLGQHAGNDEWWLAWDSSSRRQLSVLPPCPATMDSKLPTGPEQCLLFAEHPGKHGFEYERTAKEAPRLDAPHHLWEYQDAAAAARIHATDQPATAQVWASLSIAAAINRLVTVMETRR